MIMPMSVPLQMGPPSAYALSRRPWVLAVLTMQTIVCFMRCVFLLDIMGAFLMGIMIAIGVYGLRQDMNVTILTYWGLMCVINGTFDLVKVIDYMVKLGGLPLFSAEKSPQYNIQNATALLIPITTLAGVPMAWYLYKDHSSGFDPEISESRFGSGRAQADERAPLLSEAARGASNGAMGGQNFVPFEGQGQRLGV